MSESIPAQWYKAKLAQLRLVKGILKTANFETFEEFVKVHNHKTDIELSLVEFEKHIGGQVNV